MPSLFEIGPVVLEKIFKIVNVFSQFCNYLPLEKNGPFIWTNECPSPNDDLCQVWLKLAQWVLEKMKMWKVYDNDYRPWTNFYQKSSLEPSAQVSLKWIDILPLPDNFYWISPNASVLLICMTLLMDILVFSLSIPLCQFKLKFGTMNMFVWNIWSPTSKVFCVLMIITLKHFDMLKIFIPTWNMVEWTELFIWAMSPALAPLKTSGTDCNSSTGSTN